MPKQDLDRISNYCNEWKFENEKDYENFIFAAYDTDKGIEIWFYNEGFARHYVDYVKPSITKEELFALLNSFNEKGWK